MTESPPAKHETPYSEDVDPLEKKPEEARKRKKVSRACDECRRKKVRCDADGNQICSNCIKTKDQCTFSRVPLKRGPSKGYIRDLQDRANSDGYPQQHRLSTEIPIPPMHQPVILPPLSSINAQHAPPNNASPAGGMHTATGTNAGGTFWKVPYDMPFEPRRSSIDSIVSGRSSSFMSASSSMQRMPSTVSDSDGEGSRRSSIGSPALSVSSLHSLNNKTNGLTLSSKENVSRSLDSQISFFYSTQNKDLVFFPLNSSVFTAIMPSLSHVDSLAELLLASVSLANQLYNNGSIHTSEVNSLSLRLAALYYEKWPLQPDQGSKILLLTAVSLTAYTAVASGDDRSIIWGLCASLVSDYNLYSCFSDLKLDEFDSLPTLYARQYFNLVILDSISALSHGRPTTIPFVSSFAFPALRSMEEVILKLLPPSCRDSSDAYIVGSFLTALTNQRMLVGPFQTGSVSNSEILFRVADAIPFPLIEKGIPGMLTNLLRDKTEITVLLRQMCAFYLKRYQSSVMRPEEEEESVFEFQSRISKLVKRATITVSAVANHIETQDLRPGAMIALLISQSYKLSVTLQRLMANVLRFNQSIDNTDLSSRFNRIFSDLRRLTEALYKFIMSSARFPAQYLLRMRHTVNCFPQDVVFEGKGKSLTQKNMEFNNLVASQVVEFIKIDERSGWI